MTDNKIFVVMAENRLADFARGARPINWFKTQQEAEAWVDNFGDKVMFWLEVVEVESNQGGRHTD